MDVTQRLKRILRDSLQLGERAERLTRESALLGAIPEFDSMAVVSVLTMIEEEFGFVVGDDEVSADTFETLGALADFVARKKSH
ncbi:MAG: acyl carrier protein [Gammaproteobacteria bacterium]